MACNGHCNHCPSHPGYSPPISSVSWTNDPIGTLDNVEDTDFNEMRTYCISELSRWSVGEPANRPVPKDTLDTVDYTDYRWLRDALLSIASFSYSYLSDAYLADAANILNESTEEIRDQINYLRSLCVCNCNYSCTCNCNYCVCNCNYSCVCNCNYSDKELKENIKEL